MQHTTLPDSDTTGRTGDGRYLFGGELAFIYFSIVQRKVLTPNDFTSLTDLSQRLMAFEHHYQTIAQPFEWRFTRRDLATLLNKLSRPLAEAA